VKRGSIQNNEQRVRLYRWVEVVGRWSMVDVFRGHVTVALIQLQPLMSVGPGPGLLFFAAVVVLTMLAVESFDPRLIWDSAMQKKFNARFNMPDTENFPNVPEAKAVPKKRTRLSLVWVIPIVAAVAGVWIAVTKFWRKGRRSPSPSRPETDWKPTRPKITYDGLTIGTLTSVRLAPDHKHVIATAAMTPKTNRIS